MEEIADSEPTSCATSSSQFRVRSAQDQILRQLPGARRLKITIFGLTMSSSWGNGHATPYRALIRALHHLGHRVRFYEKDVPYYARHRDFRELAYCELVLYPDWATIYRDALSHAADSDVVITASYCPEGARISEEVLGLSRPLKVFYDLDTPVTFAQFATEGRTDYLHPEQIQAFDLVLSFTGGIALRKLEREYDARIARPLYGCVDPDEHHRVASNPDLQCDLSYMGTHAPDRQHKLDALFLEAARRSPAKQFLLAGTLYPGDWQWPRNVHRLDHVSPRRHAALYSSSAATLNITRRDMAESGYCPSGRFFEASACGCPILTDTWEGLDRFFSEDEILCVDSPETVLDALCLPVGELRSIATRASRRTLDEHTGAHRARQLLQYFDEARVASRRVQSEVA
jgi:spore maturation protein CgeB